MTGEHTLMSSVVPASDGLAYSEVYTDPPDLAPLPEIDAFGEAELVIRRAHPPARPARQA